MMLGGSFIAESGASRAGVPDMHRIAGVGLTCPRNKLQDTRRYVRLPWNAQDASRAAVP